MELADVAGTGARRLGADHGRVYVLPVRQLLPGDTPRVDGESPDHIRVLAEAQAPLPPILVHRQTMRVVDGMHRLRAAQLNGTPTIEARFFDGGADAAFIAAIEANAAHGLPLTLADRKAAAARIIASGQQYSDRAIARITGIAAGTVAAVRRGTGPGDHQAAPARIGRDGRVRPRSTAAGRRAAAQMIASNPGASLREVAAAAGISPGTVRDVRERIRAGKDPLPPAVRGGAPRRPAARAPGGPGDGPALLRELARDPSVRFTESGRRLLRWLTGSVAGPQAGRHHIDAVPPHSLYLLAKIARHCAGQWTQLAVLAENRIKRIDGG
jgi:ParB-like chromosome segregation protein Spo0J